MPTNKIALKPNRYWWQEEDEAKAADGIHKVVTYLKTQQSYLRERNLLHMQLYGNMDISGLDYGLYAKASGSRPQARLKLNVCKSVADTVVAKLSMNKPRPIFLTSGGDSSARLKARRLNRFLEAQFQETKIYKIMPKVALFGSVFDVGALKVFDNIKSDRIGVENTFVNELLVDELDGLHGDPRNLYQVKTINRAVLFDLFPDYEQQIDQAPVTDQARLNVRLADAIDVYEAWHLPSHDDAGNGRHIIAIKGCSLVREEYELDVFPFVTWRAGSRLLGWYGQGFVEQLIPLQLEINKLLRTIQEAMKWSVPKVFVESGSKVVTSHISNLIMGIVKYTGKMPEYKAPNVVPRELFEQLESLYHKAYEIVGVSAMSARSQKPAGLNSGVAIRESQDIESERFAVQEQDYEAAFLDAAWLYLKVTASIAERNGNYKVVYRDSKRRVVDEISWKEVADHIKRENMIMYPTNLLPRLPAGRLAKVQEMMETGLISPEDGRRLLEFPDIESVTDLYNAPLDYADAIVEKMIEKGEYEQPEPFLKIEVILPRIQMAYNKAKNDGIEEERLELLRRYMVACGELIKATQQPPAAPPQLPEAQPIPQEQMAPPPDMMGGMVPSGVVQ